MIKITVELLPHGLEQGKKVLGVMKIWNDITGTRTIGNYKYTIYKKGNLSNQPLRSGEVKNFPRTRLGVWNLLYLALKNSFEKDKVINDK